MFDVLRFCTVGIVVILCLALNLMATFVMATRDMYEVFIQDNISNRRFVGMIFINIALVPSWILKGFRYIVMKIIK